MTSTPGPELTAQERADIEACACGCADLLERYEAALAQRDAAHRELRYHATDPSGPDLLEAAESRLAAAVELLEYTKSLGGKIDSAFIKRRDAFLSTAPAQAAEPAAVTWCDREGCSVVALNECRAEAAKWRERMHATRAELDLLTQDYAGVVADRHGLSAELATARERIAELKMALGDDAGWFYRAKKAETALRDLKERVDSEHADMLAEGKAKLRAEKKCRSVESILVIALPGTLPQSSSRDAMTHALELLRAD